MELDAVRLDFRVKILAILLICLGAVVRESATSEVVPEDEAEPMCGPRQYYDAYEKDCVECERVCALNRQFCCRNCPQFCTDQIDEAFNEGIHLPETTLVTVSSMAQPMATDSSSTSAFLVIVIVGCILVVALVASVVAIIVVILYRKEQWRRNKSAQGGEGGKLLCNGGVAETPRSCAAGSSGDIQSHSGSCKVKESNNIASSIINQVPTQDLSEPPSATSTSSSSPLIQLGMPTGESDASSPVKDNRFTMDPVKQSSKTPQCKDSESKIMGLPLSFKASTQNI